MLELLLSLGAVSVFGVIAIGLAEPALPQTVRNDDAERRARRRIRER